MNGMKAKAERKRLAEKQTEDGVPIDPRDWTVDDWRDLFLAMGWVRLRVAKRHRDKVDGKQ